MAASKTIEDYLSLQRGTTYKGSLVGKPGPALLGLGSIHPGGGFRADYKTYGGECPEKLMLQPGDLFVSLKGATKDSEMIGSVARVPASVPSGRLTQDTVKLILRTPDENMGTYLYWLLRTPHYRKYCAAHARGSAVVALSREDFLSYPIPLFNAGRAHITSALDDIEAKIELNLRMNETLEAMARAIFKSWFVDFDPVRAKSEGRQPSGMDAATTALFPDTFEDSSLGKIPRGWRISTLAEFALLNPETWRKDTAPARIEYVDLSNVKWGKIETTTPYSWKEAPSRAQRVLRSGDTIVGTVRPGNGSYALINYDGLTGSTGFAVLRPRKTSFREIIYLAATAPDNIEGLAQVADGAAYPAVRPDAVICTDIVKAPDHILECFNKSVGGLLEKRAVNYSQAHTLAALRDVLLPKLISGEIRIPTIKSAEKSFVLPINREQTGKHHASEEFKEAVLISAMVGALATVQFPLGRKRYNKLIYLVHRKAAQQQQIGDRFMKKAAGPYSPWMRYQGPERIALKNGYVKRLNGSNASGFVGGINIGQIDKYISRYGFTDPLNWVVNAFRYRTNDDLELLTTIDFAVLDLLASGKPITVATVRDTIASEPNWAPKLERTLFSEERIAKALEELDQYFGLKQV